MKIFSAQRLPDKYPEMCKSYEEYSQLRELSKSFSQFKTQLMEKLRKDIDGNQCGADKIIDGLFGVAHKLNIDKDIVQVAKTRVALGNPPGKNNSLGDSINWELLLKYVPTKTELHLVTVDKKDYSSKVDNSRLAEFLDGEWKEKKNSTICYYTQLSAFFNREFPNIKLPSDLELEADLEKETAINNLVNSVSFQMTHKAIKDLRNFRDLTDAQILEIIEASTINDQIHRIHDDDDVKAFLLELITEKGDLLPPELIQDFNRIYREELANHLEDDEVVF